MAEMLRIVIVGGGIVGLATAYQLAKVRPASRIIVLEKENEVAAHQTGRNSGVIHSGIYYKPGSAKALTCRRGREALMGFCRDQGIAYDLCGKVIVAVDDSELAGLFGLARRAQENGIEAELLTRGGLRRREPYIEGRQALYIKDAGIVDYRLVSQKLAEVSCADIRLGVKVLAVESRDGASLVRTDATEFAADVVINCAGLHSDRVYRRSGGDPQVSVVPFKGEYYVLTASAEHFCQGLVYPVPDPNFPFLGVHLTPMIGGGVEAGPNAVLAWGREAYGRFEVNGSDLWETLTYPGFWRLAARHWKAGAEEMWRSLSKRAFVVALQRLCPEIREHHLKPAPSGIRAQAVRRDGALEDDFLIERHGRCLHVLNAPSPAATASLAIGQHIAEMIQ